MKSPIPIPNTLFNTRTKIEMLDVVDAQNQIIGQASRAEIHRRNLCHRAAHILIFNDQGEIFLQKRSAQKDDFPGYWDASAAGHVDAGESYLACILREVQEELGVKLIITPREMCLLPAKPENGMEFCQVFEAQHNGPFILDQDEVECGMWFDQTTLLTMIKDKTENITPTLITLLKQKKFL